MKKAIFLSTGFIAMVATTLVIIFWMIIPFNKIERLKDEYIEVRLTEEGKAKYEMVKKRPKDWVVLNKISRGIVKSILASEDSNFYGHRGVDWEQLSFAIDDFLKKGKMRGASTITQQLVKNIFLTSEKSILRKIKEILIATYLEKRVGKKKILETYLNVIEYGVSLYGIKNASDYYFNKRPDGINFKEGAFIAMLLPNPKKYARSFQQKQLTPFARRMVNHILRKLAVVGAFPREDLLYWINIPLSWERRPPAPIAPDDELIEGQEELVEPVDDEVEAGELGAPEPLGVSLETDNDQLSIESRDSN